MPQEVRDCHSLVHVTSEVSDTPLSHPLTAVMQSPRPMTCQHILLRLPLYLNGGVYIYVRYSLMLLLHYTNVHLSLKLLLKAMVIAAKRTARVWYMYGNIHYCIVIPC